MHSGVWCENLLLPESDQEEAKLIDYDLADLVNTPYPPGYNNRVLDRHSEAQEVGR